MFEPQTRPAIPSRPGGCGILSAPDYLVADEVRQSVFHDDLSFVIFRAGTVQQGMHAGHHFTRRVWFDHIIIGTGI